MFWPFGAGFSSWRERSRAMRELRQIMAAEAATLILQDSNPLHSAKVSLKEGDLQGARHYLELARMRIPDYVLTSPDTVDILIGVGDLAEAESFVLKGAKRFRHQPHYLEGYALVAERRGDFEEAARRWTVVCKTFPRREKSYSHVISCLRQLGRLDEAEALLRSTMQRLPDDLAVLHENARVAEARGDWEEARRRWDKSRHRHVFGFFGAANALHRLGRTTEARALLTEGQLRFPTEPIIAILQARIAQETGDKCEARKHWAAVRQRFPLDRGGYVGSIHAFRERQDWTEADSVGRAAIERFPKDAWPLVEYAELAHARRDWPEAVGRWAAVRSAFPESRHGYQREAEALAAAGEPQATTAMLAGRDGQSSD